MTPLKLTARNLKVTIVLDPAPFAAISVPNGSPPIPFIIDVARHTITGQFNPKSLRKACAAAAQGLGKTVVIQGTIRSGNVLEDAGIMVPPPPPAKAAA